MSLPDHVAKGKCTAGIGHALTGAGDAETLARSPADQDIWGFHRAATDLIGNASHVTQIGNGGVMMGQYGTGKRLDLREPGRLHPQRLPGETDSLDTAADATVTQWGWFVLG